MEMQRALPVPPPEFMFLVSGKGLRDDPAKFIPAGHRAHRRLLAALEQAGVNLYRQRRVLDWGCGCGRVIRHWLPFVDTHRIHGSDINSDMIGWCRDNLPFAEFSVCPLYPPTGYETGSFDLLFGGSVLTHLSLSAHIAWMREIWRLLAPGGVAVLTFHGAHYFVSRVYRADSVVTMNVIDDGLFAMRANAEEGANSYNAFTQPLVMDRIFRPFERLWHGPRHGILGDQDTVVLRKNGPPEILGVPADASDSVVLDIDRETLTQERPVRLDGRTGLIAFVRKVGAPACLRAGVEIIGGDGRMIAGGTVPLLYSRDEDYRTLEVRIPPGARGEATLRFSAELDTPCTSGTICFDFTSLY